MKETCKNCKYAEFQTTSNGRRRFDLGAECKFKVVLPISYLSNYREFPTNRTVYSYMWDYFDCMCWKELNTNEAQQEEVV